MDLIRLLPPTVALAFLTLPACAPPAEVPADDDDAGEEDDDHEHGTGEVEGHVHALLQWGDTEEIVLGTHTGMFRTQEGESELVPVFEGPDFMGLVQDPFDGDRYWSSGHWGANGMGNWGFAESTDRGASWTEISLTNQADFHQMAAAHDQEDAVVGRWSGRLHFSDDAGRSWTDYASPDNVADIEVADSSTPEFYWCGATGIHRLDALSGDDESVVTGDVSGFDRVGAGWAYGTSAGDVFVCDADLGVCDPWDGPDTGAVLHLLAGATPEALYVLTAGSMVHHTDDGGTTWELIATVE